MPAAIGIDLGMTTVRVAVWQNDTIKVINTMPCYVAFTNDERLFGEDAKNQVTSNTANTVYNIKRLLGRKCNDPKISNDLRKSTFKISNDKYDNILIELRYQGEPKRFRTEEIISMILYKMKTVAEQYLNEQVTDAVISVPAFFGDIQRQAVLDAGKIAGLNVLSLINEPTAAALSYGIENGSKRGEQTLLIFHLGGGSFDVSIVKTTNGVSYQVIASAGDENLGGENFDSRLIDHFLGEFKSKGDFQCLPATHLSRLRQACELLKINLSTKTEAESKIEPYLGIDISSKMKRDRFELLWLDLFSQIRESIENILVDAKMKSTQITNVIMVGGSTKMPKIQSVLNNIFEAHQMYANATIDVEHAVVHGAALQAGILTNSHFKDIKVLDILTKSLGTPIRCGLLMNMLAKNCRIPHDFSMVMSSVGHETKLAFPIYEGEKDFSNSNAVIKEFVIDLSIDRKTTRYFNLKVTVNASGICDFFVQENSQSHVKPLCVSAVKQNLSESDITRMTKDAVQLREVEKKMQRIKLARTALCDYVAFWKQATADETIQPSNDKYKTSMQQRMKAELEFLETCTNVNAEILEKRLLDLKDHCRQCLIVMLKKLPPWIMNLYQIKRKDLQNEYLVV